MNNQTESEDTFKTNVIDKCKHLFKEVKYVETSEGWDEPLERLCLKIEEMNIRFYDKYGLYVEVEQIKQKYGELRFYFHVSRDVIKPIRFIVGFLEWVENKLNSVKYCNKIITIKPDSENTYLSECTNENVDQSFDRIKSISNINTEYNVKNVICLGQRKSIPTKHKILYMFLQFIRRNKFRIKSIVGRETKEISVIKRYMDNQTEKFISEAEIDCSETCELCGNSKHNYGCNIGFTDGWITVICEDCAKEKHLRYWLNGKLYKDGKILEEANINQEDLHD